MARHYRCAKPITLSERELRFLSEVPHSDDLIEAELWCELETAHPGPHHALGNCSKPIGAGRLANGEAVSWWVRWEDQDGRRDVVPTANCPAETMPGAAMSEVCCLFHGHPGRHEYELEMPT